MEPMLSVKQVAELLNVNPMTIYRAIDAGELEHIRVGRSIRITGEALKEYTQPEPRRAAPTKTVTRSPVTRL